MDRKWLAAHAPYTVSKYAMTMLTLGVAEGRRDEGIAANCLWPRTLIATAAVQNLLGGDERDGGARTPEIIADAAHAILIRPARECTGNTFIDDEVLAEAGVTDCPATATATVARATWRPICSSDGHTRPVRGCERMPA